MRANRPSSGRSRNRAPSFTLLGETRFCRNQREVLVGVFHALAERCPGFLERVAPSLKGTKRRYLSRIPEEVRRGSRSGAPVQLPGGWWLRTDFMRENKLKALRTAAEIAGLRWDEDLIVDLD